MSGISMILLLIGIGVLAGIVNAAAGLASLVSYPSLLGLGMTPVMANVTSAFSTVTSGFSSIFASSKELRGHSKQVWTIVPLVLVGSIIGAFLLFAVPGAVFADVVPFCIAIAGVILIKPHHPQQGGPTMGANTKMVDQSRFHRFFSAIGIFLVGIYAGFFNAGAGVLMLTLLTVVNRQESFAVNNALKNVAMTVTNTMSWIVFAFETVIHWDFVLPLMAGNIIGGIVGPMIVRRLPGRVMQVIVGLGALVLAVSLIIRNLM